MNKASLQQGLETTDFGRYLIFYPVTDSTNTQAKERLRREALPQGTVLVAERQTAGRGTGGHHWESGTPDSLLFSLAIQSPLRHQPLSFLPAVALARILRERYEIDAHLKWPNDVLVGDRKLAGILCEGVNQANAQFAWIIGVGINVNQIAFPESICDIAISMRHVSGVTYSIERLFQDYLLEMEQLYNSEENLVEAWQQYTRMLGKTIRTTQHGREEAVKVLGLSPEGYLNVGYADGHCETWRSTTHLDINSAY